MKKLKTLAVLMALAGVITGCAASEKGSKALEPDTLTEAEIAAGVFTPEVMWKMGRIGGSALSPDGTQTLYTATWYNMAENRGVTNIYVIPTEGGEPVQLTDNAGSDSDARWNMAGDRIYFLSNRSGEGQIWAINPDGTGMTQISEIEGGINGFGVNPAEDQLFYVKSVAVEKRTSADVYPDMDKSQVLIYDDLMARHWDYWDKGSYSHIFVADMASGKVSEGTDIMQGEPWDAPMAPYFDNGEIVWNNAGTKVAYTCKKLTGTEYAQSTDSDIYIYDTASKETMNLNKRDMIIDADKFVGYDKYPVFSPDDTKIAFRSMRRPGNESDKERLFVWNSADGSFTDLTADYDSNAANTVWVDNNNIMFISPIIGTYQLCSVNADGNSPVVTTLSEGDHDITSLSMAGGKCLVSLTTLSMDTELFTFADGALTQLTHINKNIYDNVKMGEVQKRWVRTTDGKEMLTWVILPPNFDPAKKYPTLLYCQGGPQSTVSQAWSYRWNYQLMASQGYIVVAPNRRGLPSFGQEWLDQISGDYSGQNIRDYLSAIDDVAKEPWADEERMGCVGASYGGYSAYFLAGNHDKRFKAFIAHCGIFDFDSMYGSTEELFFINNDYGGPYWDINNKTAQRSYANSPHKFVAKWDTPIMIVTGLKDYRIPYTQSLEAFTAARVRGIDARLVAFENEAHQVFQPQNSLVWNREFFGWLDKYLK
jgi:dipeptidyl aminopeptidase/acylaminoacyl peptidase